MRFQHIDIAKGIGILLVIALHTDFHQEWMTTFEMPLFFLLSGLFVKIDMPFREYAIKKINTLLVPYIFLSLRNLYMMLILHVGMIKFLFWKVI